ncbi:heme o synthase [Breoghania sp. L-A4]|uniref:heme o synthase n=1 Tax=Breoghania sp. L-A4 TaxID=2304600 RepID=UPI000E3591DD|nr:heme o synthase [Breoghania sp. L-A4]AXS41381.1 protoheme IX farnesyltransferase [Breoghania sp. L-A4]
MTMTLGKLSALFKLRIGFAITLCAAAGMAMTQGPALPAWKVSVLLLAVFLSSGAAGAFNQYAERDLDARMARTRRRPFVTGEFHAGPAWLAIILGILAFAVAAAAWALNVMSALYVFSGAFVYGVVYTVWLKQRTAWNIVVGGLAGSFAVLAGSAAVDPALSPAAIALAVVLFLWTPPHFWSLATVLHKDYAAANVPMLPVIVGDAKAARITLGHTIALVAVSVVPVVFGMGVIYLAGALAGGAYFVLKSVDLVRDPGPKAARANFLASFVQLGLLLTAAIVDRAVG